MILKNILSVLKIPRCLIPVRFMVNHLFYDSQLPEGNLQDAPNQIFIVWLGDNQITPARQKSIDLIRSVNSGSKVILVSPDNLADYVLPEHPCTLPTKN